MTCPNCRNKTIKRKYCDSCNENYLHCTSCGFSSQHCQGNFQSEKRRKISADDINDNPSDLPNHANSSFFQNALPDNAQNQASFFSSFDTIYDPNASSLTNFSFYDPPEEKKDIPLKSYGNNISGDMEIEANQNFKEEYQSEDDYNEDDEEFDEDRDYEDEDDYAAVGEISYSESEDEEPFQSYPEISTTVQTGNDTYPFVRALGICSNGLGSSHAPTANTIVSSMLEVGVATWNINHLSNLINSKKTLNEKEKKTRDKTISKIATVESVFKTFDWLDILVLQEINQHSPKFISEKDDHLAYYSGPLMKSITKGKAPKNPKNSKLFRAAYNREETWVKPGQGEYYGIVIRKTDGITYDKCQLFYNGKLEDADSSRIYYWSKKFDTGAVTDDEVDEGSDEDEETENEEQALQSTAKAQKDLAGTDISELKPFRPIIIHSLKIQNKIVKIAVVHTSPKGKNFQRKTVYSQVREFLNFVSLKKGEYWIIGGDYYLEPEATVSIDGNSYGLSEVGPRRLNGESDDKYQSYVERTKANKQKPIKYRERNEGESAASYRAYKAAALKRKNAPLKLREQKGNETVEQYARRKNNHETEMARRIKAKATLLEKGALLKNQFKDAVGDKLKIAITISATNQGYLKRDAVGKIERNPNLFWGFYTCYKKEGEKIYVNNSRADFFVCTKNFGFTYAGILSPEGKKILTFDDNHEALNWWSDISDHTPVGGVFSLNNQSKKWGLIKKDLFNEIHLEMVKKHVDQLRIEAIGKFIDAQMQLDEVFGQWLELTEEELLRESRRMILLDGESGDLMDFYICAQQRLLYTFLQLPVEQMPKLYSNFCSGVTSEQAEKRIAEFSGYVGSEALDNFEKNCVENRNQKLTLRVKIRDAFHALKFLSQKFFVDRGREYIDVDRNIGLQLGGYSLQDFNDTAYYTD